MDTSSPFESCQLCGLRRDWLMPELLSQSFGGTENEIPFQLILDCAMADRLVLDTMHLFDSLSCLSCYTKRVSSASLLLISSLLTAYITMKHN